MQHLLPQSLGGTRSQQFHTLLRGSWPEATIFSLSPNAHRADVEIRRYRCEISAYVTYRMGSHDSPWLITLATLKHNPMTPRL